MEGHMGPGRNVGQRSVAIVTALSLVLSPAAPLLAGPAQAPATNPAVGPPAPKATPAPKAAPAPKASPAPHAPVVDGGWPRGHAPPRGGEQNLFPPPPAGR